MSREVSISSEVAGLAVELLEVTGYRSIRKLSIRLADVNVLVGANGCGKSNLYRCLMLVSAAAEGRLAWSLVQEGGMPSVMWAGKRRIKEPHRVCLSVTTEQLRYELSLGLPRPDKTAFNLDPVVKEEKVDFLDGRTRVPMLERGGGTWARDDLGRRVNFPLTFSDSESVLSQLQEPHRFPQLSVLRQEVLGWRFYHQFRTDWESPLRQPQVGTRTPVLSADGHDLAAALQTILEIGAWRDFEDSLNEAFPGSALELRSTEEGRMSLALRMPGFQRPFSAQELSDGTLRYLCLLAALLSPRPPCLLALNEPETSLHPDLLEPLGRLIMRASTRSQLWITTHSDRLARSIEMETGAKPTRLEKVAGETHVVGQTILGEVDEES